MARLCLGIGLPAETLYTHAVAGDFEAQRRFAWLRGRCQHCKADVPVSEHGNALRHEDERQHETQ